MASERIIYPNNPEKLSWEAYITEYPIHATSINLEYERLNNEIRELKNKMFAIVGATPRDICNENDDPFECVTNKMTLLLNDYKFLVKRKWRLSIIERYTEIIEDGHKDKLYGTIDKDTNRQWKPYIWFTSCSPQSIYDCNNEIEEANRMIDYFTEKLMMFACATPKNCYEDEEDSNSFDCLFFEAREILNENDGIEQYWNELFVWEFVKENFNDESYNA